MKIKVIIGVILISLCISTVSGQENRHMVTGGFNTVLFPNLNAMSFSLLMPGLTLEYEYMLSKNFSLGVGIGTNFLYSLLYSEIQGRWYPWARVFYVEMGLGLYGKFFYPYLYVFPEAGWKINIGKRNKWALMPTIGGRMLFGKYSDEIAANFFVLSEIGLKMGYKF